MKKFNNKKSEWKIYRLIWEMKVNFKTGRNKWNKKISTKNLRHNKGEKFRCSWQEKQQWKPVNKKYKKKKI